MHTMDKIHNGVLRKFHTLCSRLGLTEAEKRAIVESFGVRHRHARPYRRLCLAFQAVGGRQRRPNG